VPENKEKNSREWQATAAVDLQHVSGRALKDVAAQCKAVDCFSLAGTICTLEELAVLIKSSVKTRRAPAEDAAESTRMCIMPFSRSVHSTKPAFWVKDMCLMKFARLVGKCGVPRGWV